MANQIFAGFAYDDAGDAINGATVHLYDRNDTDTSRANTTTNSNGYWTISHSTEGRFDVEITSGDSKRRIKYDDQVQFTTIEVANFNIRNPANTFDYSIVPAAIVADRQLDLPLLTGTATVVVTPGIEDLDMGGFDIDNAGFLILNAATAPAGTEVYLVNDSSGDLTLNALTGKVIDLAIAGTSEMRMSATVLSPVTSDGLALGSTSLMWGDLFLASGGVINFNNGDVTLTHGSNVLTVAGGTLATAALTASTGVFSGILKTDDTTPATSTTDGSLQTDGGLSVALDAVFGDDVFLLSDSAVLNIGAGNDFTITHDGTTGATIAGNPLTLDSGADIVLDAEGADVILKDGGTQYGALTNSSGNLIIKSGSTTAATFSGANVTLEGTVGSGAITSTSTVQGTTITATTAFVPDASDGAALGTTSLEFSDLYLADGAVVGFGDDQEVTLTHVHDTGLLLSSTDKLQFGDSGTFIHQSADGVLTIESDTTVDINGAVVLNGAVTGATDITLSGELDAATLDISGNADIDGTLETDALTVGGTNVLTGSLITTLGTISAGVWQGTAITGAYINDDIISGQSEMTSGLATADELLYSDGGTVKRVGLDTLTTYLAGVNAGTVTSTGLSDSSGVLTLDIQNMTASTTIADADLIAIDDGAGGTLRKMTRANFIESAALDAINIDGGAIDGAVIGANSAAAGTFAAIVGTTLAVTTDLAVAGQILNCFTCALENDSGTLKHRMGFGGSFGTITSNYIDRISSASSTFAVTPTGADADTAFTSGCKISTNSPHALTFDTAAQTAADGIGTVVIQRQSVGTDLTVTYDQASHDVNGVTRNRVMFAYVDTATGAAFNLNTTNIASGKTILTRFLGHIA